MSTRYIYIYIYIYITYRYTFFFYIPKKMDIFDKLTCIQNFLNIILFNLIFCDNTYIQAIKITYQMKCKAHNNRQ